MASAMNRESCPPLHHYLSFFTGSVNCALRFPILNLSPQRTLLLMRMPKPIRLAKSIRSKRMDRALRCFKEPSARTELKSAPELSDRPPFDLNLAVLLAGFAFEAYMSPPKDAGKREVDAAQCHTVFLSEFFLREVYDGQLFIKLKSGYDFPKMDPWGTSDPYIVIQMDGQFVKSKVKWATTTPIWNEDFTVNIKRHPAKYLQVAAWDANLVAPHKRMGNAGISLESLCDGNLHELLVELEGMGGGGKIQLEVQYKDYDEVDKEKRWWNVPFVSQFLKNNEFASALKKIIGSDNVKARDFVQSAFGQLSSFNSIYFQENRNAHEANNNVERSMESIKFLGNFSSQFLLKKRNPEGNVNDPHESTENKLVQVDAIPDTESNETMVETNFDDSMQLDELFWKNLADFIIGKVSQKLDLPVSETIKWDGFELLKRMGSQSRRMAETWYVESGLATPKQNDVWTKMNLPSNLPSTLNEIQSSLADIKTALPDIKSASLDILSKTDAVLGALMFLTAAISKQTKETDSMVETMSKENLNPMSADVRDFKSNRMVDVSPDSLLLDQRKAEERKVLFSTAESAMEAWAMLATSLGRPSFIKSEFEKICFLDNVSTDTQVALWRDSLRKRLVVAFRGTEQVKWKDLRTDLMLVPSGLNPERIGGDIKQEVQVHSGFLSAYDSVRNRLLSLIKVSIGFIDDSVEDGPYSKWNVYLTGHSLGGALATLLALELSSSQMAKIGAISITMYNFGSPRVGNRRFAELYNEKVKDSWRIVNHRDIVPTVPRLMGYCHVAQPVYLSAGGLGGALENFDLVGDGYEADLIDEYTPEFLLNEFLKGEKELIEKILHAEINIFRAIRDGSGLMQHMEDFYYITLLERVRSNYYRTLGMSRSNDSDSLTA